MVGENARPILARSSWPAIAELSCVLYPVFCVYVIDKHVFEM